MKRGTSLSNQCCRPSSQKSTLLVQVTVLSLRCYSSYLCFHSMLCSVLHFCIFLCLPMVLLRLCQMQHEPEPQVFFYMSSPSPSPSSVLLGADKKGQWCLQLLLGPGNTANPIGIVLEIEFLERESLSLFKEVPQVTKQFQYCSYHVCVLPPVFEENLAVDFFIVFLWPTPFPVLLTHLWVPKRLCPVMLKEFPSCLLCNKATAVSWPLGPCVPADGEATFASVDII